MYLLTEWEETPFSFPFKKARSIVRSEIQQEAGASFKF